MDFFLLNDSLQQNKSYLKTKGRSDHPASTEIICKRISQSTNGNPRSILTIQSRHK